MLKEVSEMLLLQVLFIRGDELFYCVFSILGIVSMPPLLSDMLYNDIISQEKVFEFWVEGKNVVL